MKRTLVAAIALAFVGCTSPLDALLDDQLLWKFKHRDAYSLPQDETASTRDVFATTTRDGVRIYGLWLPAARSSATCVPTAVLYCPGQDGDIQDHYEMFHRLQSIGYDVLTFDYRGNGMSEGKTDDEEDTYVDAEAAAAELRRRVAGRRIVYYGESLGGAVCTELALREASDALHLDCTFASVELFVRDGAQLPIPGEYVTSVEYDTISKIGRIGVPLQIFHGAADDFIRPAHGQALYDAAANPKDLWLVPGADHGTDEIQANGGPAYDDRLEAFAGTACP
jgi:fermentation-respiration switch protein FrsA (DUF1100 family)